MHEETESGRSRDLLVRTSGGYPLVDPANPIVTPLPAVWSFSHCSSIVSPPGSHDFCLCLTFLPWVLLTEPSQCAEGYGHCLLGGDPVQSCPGPGGMNSQASSPEHSYVSPHCCSQQLWLQVLQVGSHPHPQTVPPTELPQAHRQLLQPLQGACCCGSRAEARGLSASLPGTETESNLGQVPASLPSSLLPFLLLFRFRSF